MTRTIGAFFTEFGSDKDAGTGRKPGTPERPTGHTYGPVYDELLTPRWREITALLEVGVLGGASIRAWRAWLPDRCRVVGIDNNLICGRIPGAELFQADSMSAESVAAALGDSTFDVVIDDGGHALHEQKATFENLWPRVRPGAIWITEDLQGIEAANWFVERGAEIIDRNHLSGRWDDVLAVIRRSTEESR